MEKFGNVLSTVIPAVLSYGKKVPRGFNISIIFQLLGIDEIFRDCRTHIRLIAVKIRGISTTPQVLKSSTQVCFEICSRFRIENPIEIVSADNEAKLTNA